MAATARIFYKYHLVFGNITKTFERVSFNHISTAAKDASNFTGHFHFKNLGRFSQRSGLLAILPQRGFYMPLIHCKRRCSSQGTDDDKPSWSKSTHMKLMNFPECIWPNPVKTIRNWFFKLLIAGYYDPTFRYETFIKGAEQALQFVSRHLSHGEFDELRGYVTDEALTEIKTNFAKLSIQQRKFLIVNPRDIFIRFMYEIGMLFDDETNQRFVEITVVFHGFHGLAEAAERDPDSYYKEVQGNQDKIFVCNYRFIREFTKGVNDDWTINKLNHFSPQEVVFKTPPFNR